MKMFKYLFSIGLLISSSFEISGQAIWTIKDPDGSDVLIDQDSSFLIKYNEYLLFYTINKSTGNRNILMTNGDTSFWVLNEDAPLTSDFTPFIFRKNDELIFRVGDVWYSSYGGAETTQVFYDNSDPNNEHIYLKVYELYTPSDFHHDLIIEAIEKSTGDTLTLYHSYLNSTTTPYPSRLMIIEGNLQSVGPYSGETFIAARYDSVAMVWREVGVQRQNSSGFKLLLPLGNKEKYRTNTIYYSGSDWIVDHQENGEKLVYQYTSSIDSCVDVTQNEFPNYTLLDAFSPTWPFWGPLFPDYPALSFDDFIWKGKHQNGSERYFLRSLFGQEFEIVDLRNDEDIDFIFYEFQDDSIYYYNHSDTQKGLVRTNFVNGMSVKESTSVPFDTDYTLQAYNGKMYFGRYNGQTGTIQAISKDFENDNKYEFLESTSGERIDNPINFSFLDDRIFVHSRTDDGVKLIVFDPDAIVSIEPFEKQSDFFTIAPNPSTGLVVVQAKEGYSIAHDSDYVIFDLLGSIVLRGKVTYPSFELDLTGLPSSTYQFSILDKSKVIFSSPVVLYSNK
jgi:hypothetical protein